MPWALQPKTEIVYRQSCKQLKILEKEFPNPYNVPTVYEVPIIIEWYLEGYNVITIYPERKRVFLYFAAVNGLLTITSDGNAFVAGMKVV